MQPVYYLLIALIALPLIGSAFALIAPRVPNVLTYEPLVHLAATAGMLVLAWVLRPAQVETIFGDWSPISFTGAPLILSTNTAGMSVLIALAIIMMVDPVGRSKVALPARGTAEALLFGALSITVLANNMVTMLLGLGLVDALMVLNGVLRARQPARLFRDALCLTGSLAFFVIAISLYDATGNSLYFPLARLPDQIMPFIALSMAFRFCLLPLRAASDEQRGSHWTDKASSLAGLAVLARLSALGAPELRAWFFVLVLITALIVLVLGVLTRSRNVLRGSVDMGALMIALTSAAAWQSQTFIVAAIAWFLGTTLLDQPAEGFPIRLHTAVSGARLLGALCLIGLPLTAGFAGRAGVAVTWAGRGVNGVILVVALALSQLLLTLCVLRLWRWAGTPQPQSETNPTSASASTLVSYLPAAALGLLCLHVVLFGVAPNLAGAPFLGDQLAGMGLLGWLVWLAPTLLGVAAWWFEPRWLDLLSEVRPTLLSVVGLGWWQDILTGAFDRLARPLRGILVFLESDGALLWAVIVILIVVIVTRPGAP
jgi:hypothetical protein